MIADSGIVMRRRPVPAFIFGGIAVLCWAAFLFLKQPPDAAQSLAIMSGIFGLLAIGVLLIFANTNIRIHGQGLAGKTPFRKREVEWRRILKAYIVRHSNGKGNTIKLCFEMVDGQQVQIPIKFYSAEDVSLVCKAIVAYASSADIDNRILAAAKGKIPWWRLFPGAS